MLRDIKAKSLILPPKGRSDVIKFIITSRSSRNIMNYAKVHFTCGATCKRGSNTKMAPQGVQYLTIYTRINYANDGYLTAPFILRNCSIVKSSSVFT